MSFFLPSFFLPSVGSNVLQCLSCSTMFCETKCRDWSSEINRCEWCCEDNHTCHRCGQTAIRLSKGMRCEFTDLLVTMESLSLEYNDFEVRFLQHLSEFHWWDGGKHTVKMLKKWLHTSSDDDTFTRWVERCLA
jgi:hypothetical protein